jgi:hypothetical protein
VELAPKEPEFGASTVQTTQTTLDGGVPVVAPPRAAVVAPPRAPTIAPAEAQLAAAGDGAAVPAPACKWPAWRFANMSNSLLHPTAANIKTAKLEYHRIYKPWLLGDMLRRTPGRCCSSDGTFRLMTRTRSDGQVSTIAARCHRRPAVPVLQCARLWIGCVLPLTPPHAAAAGARPHYW